MRNRIVTAVKQRFSIRKLSIGAASVLLGTSLYFMGPSAPVVHAATTGAPVVHAATEKEKTGTNDPVVVAEDSTKNDADPVVVAGDSTKNDADVNNAIDKYAQGKQEKLQGDHAPLIRPSDTQSVTVNTPGDRAYQVGKIRDKIDTDIKQANEQANKDKESIEKYKNDHPQTLSGQDSDFFKNQGLSVGDEKNSEINQISVDHKPITLLKGQSENIDGIHITHADTDKMTDKERNVMKINSDNKVIIDLQHDQCQGKEITVTYDNLNNSYYLENIDDKTNKIKISKIERTFSHILEADKIRFTSDGHTPKGADGAYDECYGPQLIIYNDPSDGFFYNNIEQVSVKDIYYDDNGNQIFNTENDKNKPHDKNKAWIFVTSLNSDGVGNNNHRGDGKEYLEKVKAENPDGTSADIEKLAGSTVTGPVEGNAADTHHGWWYSDEDNGSYNNGPYTGLAWDNNSEDNRYAFVGAVAIKYQPGLTITYGADDTAWGSHWACTGTQVVSTLHQRVIIYDHIKDGTENVTGNDDVNMTVHYVMDDGSKAPSDSKQTVNFTETGVKDKVTGKIAWTPADRQTLNDVPSPVLTGYTADIKTAKGKAVNFGDPDINVTVHYSANAQTAKITYIDDTTKKNLYSQAANGKFGQTITFETAPTDDIASYKKQGYVLVSNSFNNQTYAADNSNNVFYVHLKHKTENVTRNDTVTRTIHYLYDNGNTAQPDKTQTVSFNETGTKDYVTGETTWSNDNAQSVDSVNTPSIVGYTPDKSSIEKQSFKFGDQDVEVTVTYHANAQIAKITYIDDTTKNNLDSQAAIGKFGQAITFATAPTDEIDRYEKQGYVLVSNSFNNQTYQAVDSNNVFEVHFKHGTTTVTPGNPGKPGDPVDPKNPDDPHKYPANYTPETLTKTITRTIEYHYVDGTKDPNPVKQSVTFKGNGVLDLVTGNLVTVDQDGKITSQNGKITWDKESKDYEAVKGIDHTGYSISGIKQINSTATVDSKTGAVGTESVTPTSPNIKIVIPLIKNPDVPVAAAGSIDYIDDTTGSHIESKSFAGNVGAKINYTTAGSIKKWEAKGYDLVSNNFKDGDEVFTKGENTFEVHFKHGTIKNYLTKDSTQTIIYHYSDGSKPDEKKTETHEDTFTRTKVVDKVTGEVITTTPWTGSHTFDSKDVPVVNGYHSDKKTVGGKTATVNNPDVTDTVTYTPNGKIIPVDPSGNPIPNVPNPTYPTDPNDPTKVVPNEPVPDVPGRTPEVSTVTPEDPSQDTPVVYNPIPNVPGPSVGPSDNTPTPVTPTPGKTTEEKKPDENKDDKDVDEPDDDEDVVPTPRHHKKHNGGESSTTRPRPTGYTPAPRGSSYLDANGKVHYKLPQTGESDSEEMAAVLGGAAATIGLIGLAGAKKRRHE